MAEFLAVLTGVFQFWDNVKWFVQLLQKTPAQKRADMLKSIDEAFKKSESTGGDTSDLEGLL